MASRVRRARMRRALSWSAGAVLPGATVVGVAGLRGGAGPWLVRIEGAGDAAEAILRIGDASDPADRQRFATQVAALAHAACHGVAAPRVIAFDPDGQQAGALAVLTTVLPGSSSIPRWPSPDRMRALGAAAARLHAVAMAPRPGLPLRRRPLADVDFAAPRRLECLSPRRWWTRHRMPGTSSLMADAEDRVRRMPAPAGPAVFVHGDLWQGNTIWAGNTLTGMIDWDCAGAGPPGIDLGFLRCDVATMFGLPAAGQVLAGWQHVSGMRTSDVAYWDTVAALSTPTDMAEWLPVIHDEGRTDLDARTVTARRDTFLHAALGQLHQQ